MGLMELSKKSKAPTVRRVPVAVKVDNASRVAISGDFTRWAKDGIRLSHDGASTWRTVLDLAPGEYQYRLLVDGEWCDDPAATRRVPNTFGTENCILVVA